MTDAAIISGSLVDAKNVNTHKVMRLIIDVPAENALKVIAAFGWPTMVNPVSVAVARLTEDGRDDRRTVSGDSAADNHMRPPGHVSGGNREVTAHSRPDQSVSVPAGADKPKSPAQIAGYLCTLGSFHAFLRERFTDQWVSNAGPGRSKEEVAKETLYDICAVTSRTQLTKDNTEWHALQLAFRLWENHPELEDA